MFHGEHSPYQKGIISLNGRLDNATNRRDADNSSPGGTADYSDAEPVTGNDPAEGIAALFADGYADGAPDYGIAGGADSGTETDNGIGNETSGSEPKKRPGRPRKSGKASSENQTETSNDGYGSSANNAEAEVETARFLAPELIDMPVKGATARGRRSKSSVKNAQIEQIVSVVCKGIVALFPPIQQADGSLLWEISQAEQLTIIEPLQEMFPQLNPKVSKAVETVLNPIALVVAAYAITAPRLAITKQYIDAVQRETNANPNRKRNDAGTTGGSGTLQSQNADTGVSTVFTPNSPVNAQTINGRVSELFSEFGRKTFS